MRKKILLFSLSTIVSFFVLELVLQLFLSLTNHEVVLEKQSFFQSETYEVYKNLDNTKENIIYTFGDSFTNGGNVKYFQTYPYALWTKLGRKATVNNMGICEITTYLTLESIKKILNSGQIQDDINYTFVILAGAADMFIDGCFYESMCTEQLPLVFKTVESKDTSIKRVITNLKIFKMLSFIGERISAQYDMFSNHTQDLLTPNLKRVNSCYKMPNVTNRWSCTANVIKNIENPKTKVQIYNEILHLILAESDYTPKTATKIVSELLELRKISKTFSLTATYLINLVRHSQLQSHYAPEYIKALITESHSIVSKKDKSDYQLLAENDGVADIIKMFDTYISNVEKGNQFRIKNLQEVINVVKPHKNIKLIFMTYPLPYRDVNDEIKSLAKTNQINLIDLEEIFTLLIKEHGQKKYIDDWEHCTPEGYEVIADQIIKRL